MPSDAQTARDDLAFVRNLFDTGDGVPGWGEIYLAAGVVYGVQTLLQAAQAQRFVEDHRPRPERGEQEQQHRQFDDAVGLQKQFEDRKVLGHGARECGRVEGLH